MAIPDDFGEGRPAARGRVELPLRVRWSGPARTYDLNIRDNRMRVYEQVLAEATEDDVRRFVDIDDLVELWPQLVLPRHVRRAWSAWLRRRRGVIVSC